MKYHSSSPFRGFLDQDTNKCRKMSPEQNHPSVSLFWDGKETSWFICDAKPYIHQRTPNDPVLIDRKYVNKRMNRQKISG